MFDPFCVSTSVSWALDASGDELSQLRGGQLGRITVSIGCATLISEGLNSQSLVDRFLSRNIHTTHMT